MLSEKDRLRSAMGEAASLPPEDPIRRQIEADIARQGEWAEKEWLELLAQDEHFRIALRRVEIPPNLDKCLLEIPEKGIRSERTSIFSRIAAAVLMVVFLICLYSLFINIESLWKNDAARQQSILQSIATRAVEDHLNHRSIKIETSDPAEFRNKLAGKVPFAVVLPELGSDFKLLGGRSCKFGMNPIIYSLWKAPRGEYSLIQLKLADFDLAGVDKKELVKPKDPLIEKSPCEILFWSSGDAGFILVADRGEYLHGISPK